MSNSEDEATPGTEPPHGERAADNVVDFEKAKAERDAAEKRRERRNAAYERLIERFNQKYAIVNDGGEIRVFWERPDALRPGRYTLDRFKFADFLKMHMNRTMRLIVSSV
jgi:hypothetical protein